MDANLKATFKTFYTKLKDKFYTKSYIDTELGKKADASVVFGRSNSIESEYAFANGSYNEIGEDCDYSGVFCGYSNKISDDVKNSVIIGCKNVTAGESGTTYVQNLSINYCTGASEYNQSAKIFVTDEGKLKAVVGGREYFIALSETDPTA